MKTSMMLVLLFISTFCTQAQGELIGVLNKDKLTVMNEEGKVLRVAVRVIDYQDSMNMVAYTKKDKKGKLSLNIINIKGELFLKTYHFKKYHIHDNIIVVIEESGRLKIMGMDGAILYTDNEGADTLELAEDYMAYTKGDRLTVVLNTGKVTLSIQDVVYYRLKKTMVEIRERKARVVSTKFGKVLFRDVIKS